MDHVKARTLQAGVDQIAVTSPNAGMLLSALLSISMLVLTPVKASASSPPVERIVQSQSDFVSISQDQWECAAFWLTMEQFALCDECRADHREIGLRALRKVREGHSMFRQVVFSTLIDSALQGAAIAKIMSEAETEEDDARIAWHRINANVRSLAMARSQRYEAELRTYGRTDALGVQETFCAVLITQQMELISLWRRWRKEISEH